MPAVPPVVAPSDIPSDREQIETELIKSLLWSYFQIVRCVHFTVFVAQPGAHARELSLYY